MRFFLNPPGQAVTHTQAHIAHTVFCCNINTGYLRGLGRKNIHEQAKKAKEGLK